MKDLVLIGGGGHCISTIEIVEKIKDYRIMGILDLPENVGKTILGYPVIGTDSDICDFVDSNYFFVNTIGQIKAGIHLRKKIYKKSVKCGAVFPKIYSIKAVISKHSQIGNGTVIYNNAVINACAEVGVNCIINTGAIIEHGVTIGDHCHISTGSIINGDVKIGNDCFIASGVIVRNGVSISNNTIIGMGAIVTKDIIEPGVYWGNPIRRYSE